MMRFNDSGRLGLPGSSRRNFLRGAGVCLALPWLEALAPKTARGQLATSPTRFLPIYFPNGAAASFWGPSGGGKGANWQLSPLLEPFAPLKKKMTVFTNLENYSALRADQFVEPSHARCSGAYLTCADSDTATREAGGVPTNGTSVDQLLAQLLPRETTFASLQVGLSTVDSFCDGLDCSFSKSVSWKSASEPLYKVVNPQTVFDTIVGSLSGAGELNAAAEAEAARRRALDQSVLDAVLQNAKSTRTRLGAEDQRRLDQFLDSVRELELQVTSVGGAMAANCEQAARPGSPAEYGLSNGQDGYDRAAHAAAMNELIVMAFRCDSTRIISYMLDDARSDFVYDHLQNREFSEAGSTPGNGQVGGFHGLQHAGDSNNGYATINWWLSQQASNLCQMMDAVDEGDGSLLDHSVVLYGSGMHGSNHDANELPIVLLGGGGGRLAMDQHLVFDPTPNDRPLRDLFYTLLNEVFQVEVPSFGAHINGAGNRAITEILV